DPGHQSALPAHSSTGNREQRTANWVRRAAMRVLVTGAGGFVGSFVAAQFARAGHTVVGLDRRPRPLDPRHGVGAIPMVEADILDPVQVLDAVATTGAE